MSKTFIYDQGRIWEDAIEPHSSDYFHRGNFLEISWNIAIDSYNSRPNYEVKGNHSWVKGQKVVEGVDFKFYEDSSRVGIHGGDSDVTIKVIPLPTAIKHDSLSDVLNTKEKVYKFMNNLQGLLSTASGDLPSNIEKSTENLSQIKDKDEWLKEIRGESTASDKQGDWYPGKSYQRLLDVINESAPNPLVSQMQDIIHVVYEDFPQSSPSEGIDEILQKAVAVIKQWHNADEVWDIYYNHSPEMKPIREFLAGYDAAQNKNINSADL